MIILLLPTRARFGGQRLSEATGRALARADICIREREALRDVLDVLPRGWPVAAASRQRDAGDAAHAMWLRADPAYVRPDINGARLMSYGDALGLSAADAEALLRPLRPLFGDTGFPIDAPSPARWYLRLPLGAKLPVFPEPEQALGADLFDQLPDGPEGRRWRALLSEAQVALHNHPLNGQRAAAGLAPVNSLWFWGASALPDHVEARVRTIASEDEAITSIAALAGVQATARPPALPRNAETGDALFDLRDARDLVTLERDWFGPALDALRSGEADVVRFDFDDGARYDTRRAQKWRFWRRPVQSFVGVVPEA